jgi:putative transcriptional regulator
MSIFNELKSALEQACEIEHGKRKASRITRYEVADVRRIRAQLNVSQAQFAEALGTSVDTVKSWESKRRNPTGLAAKVLNAIDSNPAIYYQLHSR